MSVHVSIDGSVYLGFLFILTTALKVSIAISAQQKHMVRGLLQARSKGKHHHCHHVFLRLSFIHDQGQDMWRGREPPEESIKCCDFWNMIGATISQMQEHTPVTRNSCPSLETFGNQWKAPHTIRSQPINFHLKVATVRTVMWNQMTDFMFLDLKDLRDTSDLLFPEISRYMEHRNWALVVLSKLNYTYVLNLSTYKTICVNMKRLQGNRAK